MAKLKIGDIKQGDEVFLHDGEVAFGTVQRRPANDASEIVIYVEDSGEFLVPIAAIKGVHDGKVLLDKGKLRLELQEAIKRAHAHEDASVSEREDDEFLEDKEG